MERQSSDSVRSSAAREQLRAARQAYDASVRRATAPAWCILALSVFCGVQTVAPAYKGPGNVVTIIAVGWLMAALLNTSARNQWRSLRSLPKPQWGVAEVTLICVAVLVGGVVGPHLLAGRGSSALASWGLGAAVAVIVVACMFAANASYRHRSSRVWQR
jgi:peptidoglycan/LPS O-acetylase OafA/YrhL